MRILKIEPHLSEDELKKVIDSQKTVRDFKDRQILYSVQTNQGKRASEIADILCINVYNTNTLSHHPILLS